MTDEPVERRNDPAWDADVRWKVQAAVNALMRTAREVSTRYSDPDGGYAAPDPVPDGDVTGLVHASYEQVIRPLREAIDETRGVLREVMEQVDAHKSQNYGDGYRPMRRNI